MSEEQVLQEFIQKYGITEEFYDAYLEKRTGELAVDYIKRRRLFVEDIYPSLLRESITMRLKIIDDILTERS